MLNNVQLIFVHQIHNSNSVDTFRLVEYVEIWKMINMEETGAPIS